MTLPLSGSGASEELSSLEPLVQELPSVLKIALLRILTLGTVLFTKAFSLSQQTYFAEVPLFEGSLS